MIRKTILPLLLLVIVFSNKFYANNEAWTYLDNMTDQALLLTKQEKYMEAKQILEHFSDQFVKTHPQEKHITMNDLRVISISTDEAIQALTAVSLDQSERIRKVTQLRLALDALHSNYQPLWQQMEKQVLDSFVSMKEAALESDKEKFKQNLNNFAENLDTIYPSLVLDLDPDEITRIDSHLRFLEGYDHVDVNNKHDHLSIMEKDMFQLFGKTRIDITDPSLIWVITMTGSIILLTLLYVGLKKYRAEAITSGK